MTIMSMVQRVRWRQYAAAGLCALVTLLFMSSAWAQAEPIPPLTDWVTDTTATFTTQQKQALSTQLQSLEEEKGSQIFVLIVPTTGEDTIESYARRAYDAWQVGRESVDDGILLVVAKADRRLRIEVGYGLEGAVTDLQSGRIIREQITPRFREDDYVGGIQAGVNSLISLVKGEELPPPPVQSAGQQGAYDDEGPGIMLLPLAMMAFLMPSWFAAFAIGVFVFLMFWSLPFALLAAVVAFVLSKIGRAFGAGGRSSSGRASRRGAVIGGLGGGMGGFGGGGGGFGGGGFGGGGGGSSGGGGASGSW